MRWTEIGTHRLVERTLAAFGRLDIALNDVAADIRIAPTAEVTDAESNTSVAVNLKGLWLCTQHEIVAMQRGGGDGRGWRHRHIVPAPPAPRLVGTGPACAPRAAGPGHPDGPARAAG